MFKRLLLSLLCFGATSASAQTLLFEVQAPVTEGGVPYSFVVWGDREGGSVTAYGVQVVNPDGKEQVLQDFESLLPENSEADALVVEDVNFDGYADFRVMEYLPGGSSNIPFFYWIFQPETQQFVPAPDFSPILSPELDPDNRMLLSRQKLSANEFVTEFYSPQGTDPNLVKKEVRTYSADGSSKIHVFAIKTGSQPQLVESRQLGPGE